MGASFFLSDRLWFDSVRDGEKFVNRNQIRAVIHWVKEVQSKTIDIDASNELEFVVRYLEEMEGKKDDF